MEIMNRTRFKAWMDIPDDLTLDGLTNHAEKKCPLTNTCKLKDNPDLVLNCAIFQHKIMQLIGKKHDPR